MTYPLQLTLETWGETLPELDQMLAYEGRLANAGLHVQEWRIHPRDMRAFINTTPLTTYAGNIKSIIGAPVQIDAFVTEGKCRVLIRVEGVTVP